MHDKLVHRHIVQKAQCSSHVSHEHLQLLGVRVGAAKEDSSPDRVRQSLVVPQYSLVVDQQRRIELLRYFGDRLGSLGRVLLSNLLGPNDE